MSVLARLAGFAAALGLVFAAAAFAGSRIDVDRGTRAAADADAGGHGGEMAEMAADPVRGLAVSDDAYTLELARRAVPRGQSFELAFRIVDRAGRTVRAFDVEHTKRMHLIVARRDLAGFQHLHPTQAPDGTWSTRVTLKAAGTYRVFADFATKGAPHTLADDLTVDGPVRSRPLPAPAERVAVDGLQVTRRGLAFEVTRNGAPVAIDDYLGAKGHLVALRRGDLAFLHVHPDADRLRFATEFPTPGEYRLFLQFRSEGEIHTAAFTEEVRR